MAPGLQIFRITLISNCQPPITCAAHNHIKLAAFRGHTSMVKSPGTGVLRDAYCLCSRKGRKHVAAHRAAVHPEASQPHQDTNADGEGLAKGLSPTQTETSRQTYSGTAVGAQMEVLVDEACGANALAVLQTQRPTHLDAGVLCCLRPSCSRH